jgi:uncharacterized protein YdaU (DUF1376 family)
MNNASTRRTMSNAKTFESPWWYRQVPRDFMSSPDVQLMTAEECGSFFFLIQWTWLTGDNCTLPNDPSRLAKLARVEKVSEIVLNKFAVDKDGRLYNPRLSQEWQEALRRSKDGKNNAKKRWDGSTPRHSRRNATALPRQSDANATNTNTNTNTNKLKLSQTHASFAASAEASSGTSNTPTVPGASAMRVTDALVGILGRTDLKPATLTAWAQQAQSLLGKHDDVETILAVMRWSLVDSGDGFWRGRCFAMKNFVRSFGAMLTQFKRDGQTPGAAADPLAARAASLKSGHDFSAIAKGDL